MTALHNAVWADLGGGYGALVHCSQVAPGSHLRWSYASEQWVLILDRW